MKIASNRTNKQESKSVNSPWVKLVLAISLDGRLALPSGEATHLGGQGDRKVLEEALAWADASLLGAGTLRAHQNTCLIKNKSLIKQRILEGRSEQPIVFVISKKNNFDFAWPFFQQPIERWLLSNRIGTNKIDKGRGFANQIKLKNTWERTLLELNQKGFSRLILLGGACLIESLLKEDKIDELQLTITPKILGGQKTWLSHKANNLPSALKDKNAWVLKENYPITDNEILLRYVRERI